LKSARSFLSNPVGISSGTCGLDIREAHKSGDHGNNLLCESTNSAISHIQRQRPAEVSKMWRKKYIDLVTWAARLRQGANGTKMQKKRGKNNRYIMVLCIIFSMEIVSTFWAWKDDLYGRPLLCRGYGATTSWLCCPRSTSPIFLELTIIIFRALCTTIFALFSLNDPPALHPLRLPQLVASLGSLYGLECETENPSSTQ
jgi:hypothetical protein